MGTVHASTALAYLRAAYGYAVEELELFDRNPCRRVRLAKIIKEIPRTIPNQRLREMRDACRDDGDWLTLAMFMYTGMRTIEVRRLTWNDVSLSEGTMRVFGKGDKWRVVPIHQRLRRILIGRVFDHGSVHVVPGRHGGMVSAGGLHYRLKRIADEDVRNHDFRRTVDEPFLVAVGLVLWRRLSCTRS